MDQNLARRIAYLEDRLAIQDLRHTYWLSVAERDLEKMLSCYAEDAHSQFGFGFDLKGLEQLRPFYQKQFSNPDLVVQVPYGTNGLIELQDDAHATGSWLIDVVVIKKSQEHGTHNGVRYHEKYRKIDGAWKIAYQRTDYLFFEEMKLRDSP